jgi:hypothetical protein
VGKSLAGVTGIETIKTLVASLSAPDFSVDELAEQTGVSRRTVATIVGRYDYAFEKVPGTRPGVPGRPAVRRRLRPEHLDEVVEVVESHQLALGGRARAEDASNPGADSAAASMIMAAVAIARIADSPEEAAGLVAAARNSLSAAGFGPDGAPWAGQPGHELLGKALLVAAVTDVVEACAGNDQVRIDEAQAHAMSCVVEAKQYMPAAEWLPLARRVVRAPGTILLAPVAVRTASLDFFSALFPTLETLDSFDKESIPPGFSWPSGFVWMGDTRATSSPSPWSVPAAFLFHSQDPRDAQHQFALASHPSDLVVVSSKTAVLKPAAEYRAQFVLERGDEDTKAEIANVVNSRACGFMLQPGFHLPLPPGAIAVPETDAGAVSLS